MIPAVMMTHKNPAIWLLNGPNLNTLGQREAAHYGGATLSDIEQMCVNYAALESYDMVCRQSAHEGQLVDWVHEAHRSAAGLLINGGAYSHTSIAIMDALSILSIPIVEVHLSNVYQRESFRQTSYIAKVATGTIAGFKENSYILGLKAIIDLIQSTHVSG